MTSLLQDLKYGLRMLAKNPGFTAVAVVTLALGIGANTAIFSVVNAVLLQPLPFPQPSRIVQPMRQYKSEIHPAISVPLFNYWRQHNEVFGHLAAYSFLPVGFNVAARGLPQRVAGVRVSAEFFQVLGINPILGRGFLPDEDRPGGARVAILGNDLWRIHFGADPGLIGHEITLDGQPFTVVGVTPPGFRFPVWADFGIGTDLWTPLQLPPQSRDPANNYAVLGRLKPNVTPSQAAASLSILTQQLRKEFPGGADEEQTTAVEPLRERLVGDVRPALLVLMVAVGLVLLIACVNVANLMLSRAAIRSKEIAVRTALGAGHGRIIRQLTAESLLLALLGGVLGLLVALEGDHLLVALSPVSMPQLAEPSLDWRVLLFTLGVSVLTGIFFGLAPALNASKVDLHDCLKEGSLRTTAGREHRKLSGILVVCETALSLMLLVGAGLLLASFVKLANVDPGFDPRHVLTFETTLPESKYGNPAALSTFYSQVLDRLRVLPGVEAAANVTTLPTEMGPDLPFNIEGGGEAGPNQSVGDSEYRAVSPDYFRAMRIPLIRGRSFTAADTANSPGVVTINETMAHQFWPQQDALGQTIIIGKPMGPEWTDRRRQVVGVVGDVKDMALNQPAPAEMFVPFTQVSAYITAFEVREIPTRWVLRTRGDPHALAAATSQAVLSVDANEPVASVKTMEEVLSGSISRWRFNMLLVGIFAALALILAAVGLYGLLAYSVARRTHEIGIRMALGASKAEVVRLVVSQGLRLAILGVGLGNLGALALTRFLSSLLYGVKTTDPVTFAEVSLLLTAVAFLASYLPARRATKVEPMVALRCE